MVRNICMSWDRKNGGERLKRRVKEKVEGGVTRAAASEVREAINATALKLLWVIALAVG